MINFKKYLLDDLAEPLFLKVLQISKVIQKKKIKYYVIHRSPGAGMFSNINYVLNHIKYASKQS